MCVCVCSCCLLISPLGCHWWASFGSTTAQRSQWRLPLVRPDPATLMHVCVCVCESYRVNNTRVQAYTYTGLRMSVFVCVWGVFFSHSFAATHHDMRLWGTTKNSICHGQLLLLLFKLNLFSSVSWAMWHVHFFNRLGRRTIVSQANKIRTYKKPLYFTLLLQGIYESLHYKFVNNEPWTL